MMITVVFATFAHAGPVVWHLILSFDADGY